MAELTYRDAVARGIAQEMARDPDVIFFGEDVAKPGGVFKATVGLYEQFGPRRVRDRGGARGRGRPPHTVGRPTATGHGKRCPTLRYRRKRSSCLKASRQL